MNAEQFYLLLYLIPLIALIAFIPRGEWFTLVIEAKKWFIYWKFSIINIISQQKWLKAKLVQLCFNPPVAISYIIVVNIFKRKKKMDEKFINWFNQEYHWLEYIDTTHWIYTKYWDKTRDKSSMQPQFKVALLFPINNFSIKNNGLRNKHSYIIISIEFRQKNFQIPPPTFKFP